MKEFDKISIFSSSNTPTSLSNTKKFMYFVKPKGIKSSQSSATFFNFFLPKEENLI